MPASRTGTWHGVKDKHCERAKAQQTRPPGGAEEGGGKGFSGRRGEERGGRVGRPLWRRLVPVQLAAVTRVAVNGTNTVSFARAPLDHAGIVVRAGFGKGVGSVGHG